MNKETLQANIDRMKLELADMEAKLKESDKVVLEYSNNFYKVNSASIEHRFVRSNTTKEQHKHARYRNTKEQAEEALLRELQANRIEALARKLEPNWKANWDNPDQVKCSVYYDYRTKKYDMHSCGSVQVIGVPYMSKQTAETICSYLNDGRYSLDMED